MSIHMKRTVHNVELKRSIAGWIAMLACGSYVIRKPLSYDLNGYNGGEPTVDAKAKGKWLVFKRNTPEHRKPVAIVDTLKMAVFVALHEDMHDIAKINHDLMKQVAYPTPEGWMVAKGKMTPC